MSRSAVLFVLIRSGERRMFAEIWGNLARELIWGPQVLEQWLAEGEEIDDDIEDIAGLAVVDFDSKSLTWGDRDSFSIQKAKELHTKLVQSAWQGFSVKSISPTSLDAHVNELLGYENGIDDEEPYNERHDTVAEAAECFFLSEEELAEMEEEDESFEPFSEGLEGAWITIADPKSKIRQRGLESLPNDLLSGNAGALQAVAKLPPIELPKEKYVTEGIHFDLVKRSISYWGNDADPVVKKLNAGWKGWNVQQIDGGYTKQCEFSGLPGKPVSDAEALGTFMAKVLSNKRFTMANLLGAVGSSLKSNAIKATGCLTMILALPIILAAGFLGKWKEGGYALIALVVIIVILFKIAEYKLKSKFKQSTFAEKDEYLEEQRSPAAGPLDENVRREKLDEILAKCDLPLLKEIEPHFEDFADVI